MGRSSFWVTIFRGRFLFFCLMIDVSVSLLHPGVCIRKCAEVQVLLRRFLQQILQKKRITLDQLDQLNEQRFNPKSLKTSTLTEEILGPSARFSEITARGSAVADEKLET
jgi:hypothetical protein